MSVSVLVYVCEYVYVYVAVRKGFCIISFVFVVSLVVIVVVVGLWSLVFSHSFFLLLHLTGHFLCPWKAAPELKVGKKERDEDMFK